MPNWIWVPADVLLAIHDRQIAEHGGAAGARDAELVESAIARPQNLAAYGEPDAAALAAAYAFGIAKNDVFTDGNKRTAWVAARLFLRVNGVGLTFDPAAAVTLMEGVARNAFSEAELAAWFRPRIGVAY